MPSQSILSPNNASSIASLNNAQSNASLSNGSSRNAQSMASSRNAQQSTLSLKERLTKAEADKTLESLGLTEKAALKKQNLATDKNDFMQLLLAQLRHQDPLNPQEGADFVAQLAQFNAVESMQNLNHKMEDMLQCFKSAKLMEAANLVGKNIEVPTNKMQLKSFINQSGEMDTIPIKGKFILPDVNPEFKMGDTVNLITDMRVNITNAKGELIQQSSFGPQKSPSKVTLLWDGSDASGKRITNANGEPIEDGEYSIEAQIMVNGEWLPVKTLINTAIDSISIDQVSKKMQANTSSAGGIDLDQIEHIS